MIYGLFAMAIGYFADSPAYTHFPPDKAMIKMAFAHGGQPKEPCRRLSPEELAKLAPNMRRVVKCERERVPLYVELIMDDNMLYQASLPPTGLAKDGPSKAYERFAVPPGHHEVVVRLRDTPRSEGFDYEKKLRVELEPREILAIDFRAEMGGFFIYNRGR